MVLGLPPSGGTEGQRTDFAAGSDAEFDGNRWNDLHYSRAVKRRARERHLREESDT